MRRTNKYIKALKIFPDYQHNSNEELYSKLIAGGYYWDPNISQWIYTPGEQNDSASTQIRVRVWFDKNQVQGVADLIVELLADQSFRLVDKSEVYTCRPPKGNDGRVYLTFTNESWRT